VPRKCGKSTIAAGVALALLVADKEPGAQVFSAAVDRDQASIVFNAAKNMAAASTLLNEHLQLLRKIIVYNQYAAFYKALSADAYSKHGLNAHGVIFDELHVQKTRELYDVLHTSTGSRTQPLEFLITTAGSDRTSLCWEIHEHAVKVARGQVQDDRFLTVIYTVDEDKLRDDPLYWTTEAAWREANPGIGVSIQLDYLKAECERARVLPAYENTFKRLHLNIWTEQATRWIPVELWDDAVMSAPFDQRALADQAIESYAALDLSATTDLTAFAIALRVDGFIHLVVRCWMPESKLQEREKKGRVPWRAWVDAGWLTLTPGDVVDYNYVRESILSDFEAWSIKDMGFDRWNSSQLITDLKSELGDEKLFAHGQGFASMSGPTKEFETAAVSRNLRHGGNPLLRWAVSNAAALSDPAGNIKPDKSKSGDRIDPVVAAVMAVGRLVAHDAPSESTGVISLTPSEAPAPSSQGIDYDKARELLLRQLAMVDDEDDD
jgi:phage terminase large subunit-like protein